MLPAFGSIFPAHLTNKTVALLTSRDLRQWRDSLIDKGLAPASINRSSAAFKAALNLAAALDERIVNHRAWEKGLATIPDAVEARNVIVAERDILKIIDGAYEVSAEFGLLVEVDASYRCSSLAIEPPRGSRLAG